MDRADQHLTFRFQALVLTFPFPFGSLLPYRIEPFSLPYLLRDRAVQSSSVLKNRRGADGGSKRKSAGDYSVGPTGRKRNITAMYDGDSDDMNDLL